MKHGPTQPNRDLALAAALSAEPFTGHVLAGVVCPAGGAQAGPPPVGRGRGRTPRPNGPRRRPVRGDDHAGRRFRAGAAGPPLGSELPPLGNSRTLAVVAPPAIGRAHRTAGPSGTHCVPLAQRPTAEAVTARGAAGTAASRIGLVPAATARTLAATRAAAARGGENSAHRAALAAAARRVPPTPTLADGVVRSPAATSAAARALPSTARRGTGRPATVPRSVDGRRYVLSRRSGRRELHP